LSAFKFNEASSSDYPPDKNIIPTHDGNTLLLKAIAVLKAISYGVDLLLSGFLEPGVTIFGFNNIPSKKM
jgi:hypothetical protein